MKNNMSETLSEKTPLLATSEKLNNETTLKAKNQIITSFDLPEQVWLEIFKFLADKDLLTVGKVSKRFQKLTNTPALWLRIATEKYPNFPNGISSVDIKTYYVSRHNKYVFFSKAKNELKIQGKRNKKIIKKEFRILEPENFLIPILLYIVCGLFIFGLVKNINKLETSSIVLLGIAIAGFGMAACLVTIALGTRCVQRNALKEENSQIEKKFVEIKKEQNKLGEIIVEEDSTIKNKVIEEKVEDEERLLDNRAINYYRPPDAPAFK